MDGDAVIPARPDLSRDASEYHLPIDISVEQTADWRVLVVALVVAVVADLAVRSGGAGAAGALLVTVAAGGMLATGRVRNPHAIALVAAAPVFGVWLMLRTSPALLPLDVLAACGLLALGASLARGGSVLDLSPVSLVARGAHASIHAVAAPGFLGTPVRSAWQARDRSGRPARARGVLRGLLFAVPILIVLGVLLGSADPVFASWFRVPASPPDVFVHMVVLVLAVWGMGGLLRVASARAPAVGDVPQPSVGSVEALVILAGLVALFLVFVVAQVVTALGGAGTVLETRGLTYAQYARSGFFQLVAVAVITLAVLLALRAFTRLDSPRSRRVFLTFGLTAVALTLAIVWVAVHRMQLYEREFGLTMLRLKVEVATLAIGAVFVALAIRVAGAGRRRAWLTSAIVAIGLMSVLALDVMNPEAMVASTNMDRALRMGTVDVAYLSSLSADAVPILVTKASALPRRERKELRSLLCERGIGASFHGWAAWNLATSRAQASLEELCAGFRLDPAVP